MKAKLRHFKRPPPPEVDGLDSALSVGFGSSFRGDMSVDDGGDRAPDVPCGAAGSAGAACLVCAPGALPIANHDDGAQVVVVEYKCKDDDNHFDSDWKACLDYLLAGGTATGWIESNPASVLESLEVRSDPPNAYVTANNRFLE